MFFKTVTVTNFFNQFSIPDLLANILLSLKNRYARLFNTYITHILYITHFAYSKFLDAYLFDKKEVILSSLSIVLQENNLKVNFH